MANSLYDIGRESFLADVTVGAFTGQTDWVNDEIRARLIYDHDNYVPDLENHTSVADLPPPDLLTWEVAIFSGKSAIDGVASADTLTFKSVKGGNVASAIVVYRQHSANLNSNHLLIAYIDTISGLPVETNGTDISIFWDGGSGRIFRL